MKPEVVDAVGRIKRGRVERLKDVVEDERRDINGLEVLQVSEKLGGGSTPTSAVPLHVATDSCDCVRRNERDDTGILQLRFIGDIDEVGIIASKFLECVTIEDFFETIVFLEANDDIIGSALHGPAGDVGNDQYLWFLTTPGTDHGCREKEGNTTS
jgi:hypothetical protein